MKSSLVRSFLLRTVFLTLVLGGSYASPALATDHCASAQGNPPPPGDDPVPFIGGTLYDESTVSPVQGATVSLYVCVEGTSVFVDSETTNSAGRYVFSELDGPSWYYVSASLTGPLANKVPSGTTLNPSALVGVGEGDGELDMSFE